MSEMEKKRETSADLQKDANKRADSVDGKDKKKGEEEGADSLTMMQWDPDLDDLMDRIQFYVRDLSVSMSHSEFKSLLVTYRELSSMSRRAVGNRLQQRHCNALFRALHKGDYSEYQQTWHADAEAFKQAEEAANLKPGG